MKSPVKLSELTKTMIFKYWVNKMRTEEQLAKMYKVSKKVIREVLDARSDQR